MDEKIPNNKSLGLLTSKWRYFLHHIQKLGNINAATEAVSD